MIIGILAVILIGGGLYFVSTLKPKNETTSVPVAALPYADEIHIKTPLQNTQVISPIKITGEARGSWYFEGSFTAELFDSNSSSLGSTQVTAQSAWTTENFVPFLGNLTFSSPATKKGSLIIKNSNPSGLPENEKQITIPVSF